VARKSKKLPKEVVDHWPEVLNDIDIDVVPIEYLDSIRIGFVDGKVWDIDLKDPKNQKTEKFEDAIEELFQQYEDVIQSVDFRLDTERVKRDITKRTHQFMKKRK
jgi:hypothetical protein